MVICTKCDVIIFYSIPNALHSILTVTHLKNDYKYRNDIGYMPQIGRYPDNMTIGRVIESIKHIRSSRRQLDTELMEKPQH